MTTTRKFVFNSIFARRLPDPVFHKIHGIERFILMMPVNGIPEGLPNDPNARLPKTRRRVYRDIEESLFDAGDNTPGTFHLKHKGITLIADAVHRRGESNDYSVTCKPGHGIVDGGHTYELITKNKDNPHLPKDQYVKFEIITNIPEDWISEIAGGLNTSIQVEDMSLYNLANSFDWIKDELKDQPYFDRLAWREGEDGNYDARDLIALMACFLIGLYPNNASEHPVFAYEKKKTALDLFAEHEDEYRKVRPILRDILRLYDTISLEAKEKWNKATGGRAGLATFVEKRKRGLFEFIFVQKEDEYRLHPAAAIPMLAAFRWMVEDDPSKKKYRWRGGFKSVLERWEHAAPELMKLTFEQNKDSGRTLNALGKSRAHWNNLHTKLAKIDQETELAELRAAARR